MLVLLYYLASEIQIYLLSAMLYEKHEEEMKPLPALDAYQSTNVLFQDHGFITGEQLVEVSEARLTVLKSLYRKFLGYDTNPLSASTEQQSRADSFATAC
jgi:hypothetical protein